MRCGHLKTRDKSKVELLMDSQKRTSGKRKGSPKTGGREKGTPNKRSLELLKGLMAYDCLPAQEIAGLLKSPELYASQKIEAWEHLLPYLFPQQKAIDPDGYLMLEQVAGMLGAQATKFRNALEAHVADPMTVATILEVLRGA